MAKTTRAFRTPCAVSVDAVAGALQPKYTVAVAGEQTVSYTWLDTFDWRLHTAGISLEHIDGGPLTAHLPSGSRLRCPLPDGKWPAHFDELPAGRLRDTIAPIVAPRALLPVITLQCTARESRVLNADEKTVARLVEETGDDGIGRLQVEPLRGYDGDADRITSLLSGVDGLAASTTTPYDDALARAGRSPSDYARNPAALLRPETPASVAIATVLTHFADAIDDNVAGTITAIDTEFLHDLRVAVRRSRSILKLAGDVLPDDLAERFAPEFKWLGDLTTRCATLTSTYSASTIWPPDWRRQTQVSSIRSSRTWFGIERPNAAGWSAVCVRGASSG